MHARTHAVTDSTTECKEASEVAKERRGGDKRDGEAIKKKVLLDTKKSERKADRKRQEDKKV